MKVLRFLCIGIALATVSEAGIAQQYPTRPVRILVGNAPGGVTDIAARVITPRLSQLLGQSFVVDNRPGATGAIAGRTVAKAIPDGYTLLMGNVADMAVNPLLMKDLGYDTIRDFMPISTISNTTLTIAVNPSVPARTLPELIALAKAKPRTLSFASAGNGTVNQIVGEWINHAAGIEMLHIPYKGGGPATADVLAGQVPIGVLSISNTRQLAHLGKLRVLATSSAQRTTFEPTWPTVAESGFPGFDASVWVAIFAPANTPSAVTNVLSSAISQILRRPDVIADFNEQGAEVMGGSPAELSALMRNDRERYGRMLAEFNIQGN
jgi:tripartite-type tricarboxylate transporter receptor subunit TctC